jgi:hypothetical protein
MRELAVRLTCFAVNLVIGEPRTVLTAAEERALALARVDDPYFHAFRNRCMQWVSGEDPRRSHDAQDYS